MLLFDNEMLFGSFTNLFVLGWLALFIATFLAETNITRRYLLLVGGRIIPLVLLAVFVLGWFLTRGLPGDILSFEGVLLTNSVAEKVLVAWFEVLGLALLVARWMIEDAAACNCPRGILVIALMAAFVAAAIGLIAYLIMSRLWIRFAAREAEV